MEFYLIQLIISLIENKRRKSYFTKRNISFKESFSGFIEIHAKELLYLTNS